MCANCRYAFEPEKGLNVTPEELKKLAAEYLESPEYKQRLKTMARQEVRLSLWRLYCTTTFKAKILWPENSQCCMLLIDPLRFVVTQESRKRYAREDAETAAKKAAAAAAAQRTPSSMPTDAKKQATASAARASAGSRRESKTTAADGPKTAEGKNINKFCFSVTRAWSVTNCRIHFEFLNLQCFLLWHGMATEKRSVAAANALVSRAVVSASATEDSDEDDTIVRRKSPGRRTARQRRGK